MPLSKESQSINKWNLGGQVYIEFIKLNTKADAIFDSANQDTEQVKYYFLLKIISVW